MKFTSFSSVPHWLYFFFLTILTMFYGAVLRHGKLWVEYNYFRKMSIENR